MCISKEKFYFLEKVTIENMIQWRHDKYFQNIQTQLVVANVNKSMHNTQMIKSILNLNR